MTIHVDLAGLWQCVKEMGAEPTDFTLNRHGEDDMQDDFRGEELFEIALRHGLDLHAFGGDDEFVVIGSERSIRNLRRLIERMEHHGKLPEGAHDAF